MLSHSIECFCFCQSKRFTKSIRVFSIVILHSNEIVQRQPNRFAASSWINCTRFRNKPRKEEEEDVQCHLHKNII